MTRNISKRKPSILSQCLLLSILAISLFLAYKFLTYTLPITSNDSSNLNEIHSSELSDDEMDLTESIRTLVVYVCTKKHALAEENLKFFIRNAVSSLHDVDYYFILQNGQVSFNVNTLPELPSNAHYIQHQENCFEIGTIGWFLSNGTIDKTIYKYFIFLNSAVRGPFIVAYYDYVKWYTIFTERLNNDVKLVGSTLSCDNFPHVRSYSWAMDLETLDFLLMNSTVFSCSENKEDTIEIDASRTLLQAGYGIGALMTKYRGVDFRVNSKEKCTDKLNPMFSNVVDGIELDPYEIVFVQTNVDQRHNQEILKRLDVYGKWLDQREQ